MLTADEIREIASNRYKPIHKGIGCMQLPTGECSKCHRKPSLTFQQINDVWNAWYIENKYGSEIPHELFD